MDTIIGILIVIIFIAGFIFTLKNINNQEHDFSGDLEKEKESPRYVISKIIEDIKTIFR